MKSPSSSIAICTVLLALALPPTPAGARGSANETRISQGIKAANQARRSGKFSEAFSQLAQLAKRYSEDPRIQHELGVLYAIHGQLGEAASRLGNALRLDPLMMESRRGLAEVLRADGRCHRALGHYQKLVDRSRHRVVGLRGVALCQEMLGDLDAARAALQLLIRDHGEAPIGAWAKDYLPSLDSSQGVTPRAAEREGMLHFKSKNYAAAAAWFELACGRGPSADRCFRLATARVGCNDLLGASIALRVALRIDPKHMPSLSAWARVARGLRARGKGGVGVRLSGNHGKPVEQRIAEALLEDDLLLAEQLATASIQSGNKGRVLRWLRAETRLRSGHLTWASDDLDVIERKHKKLSQVTYARAAIAARLQQWQSARKILGLAAPPRPPEGRELPAEVDVQTDIKAFLRWRRSATDHQIRRLLDVGLRPFAEFVPPVFFNPESVRRWPRDRQARARRPTRNKRTKRKGKRKRRRRR